MKHDHHAVGSLVSNLIPQTAPWGRRTFAKSLVALAGSAGLFRYDIRPAAAEPPPETTKLRVVHGQVACFAPFYLAEELLHLEGFTEVEYLAPETETGHSVVAAGRADLTQWDVGATLPLLDEGKPLVVLSGLHAGCQELFANQRVQSIKDLKGKRIAVSSMGNGDHMTIATMLAYIGIDPSKGVTWVAGPKWSDAMELFIQDKADAFIAFPPQPAELRRKKIGRVIINTTHARPWSQYFCCVIASNRKFVEENPVATKRALRAFLKAADICAQDPERAARYMVDKAYQPNYAAALAVVKDLPYRRWREADPEDTLRFHALRLHEVGIIKSTPKQIIAQGTDWRFLKELKRELKA